MMPLPAVIHCTSPAPIIPRLPRLSPCSTSPASTQVIASIPRCGCQGKPRWSSAGSLERKSSRRRKGSSCGTSWKPKARRRCTPAPSMVGLLFQTFSTRRVVAMLLPPSATREGRGWRPSGFQGLRITCPRRVEQRGEIVAEQFTYAFDRHVGWRTVGHVGGAGVMALARKHRRQARAPDALDGGQDAQLVVDEHVVLGGMPSLDILELAFLVNVDEDTALHRVGEPRALDLAGLEDHIAVGEDDGGPPRPAALHN